MRIGLINQLHGRPGTDPAPPSWASIEERARVAEAVGFDSFVFEDALLYRGTSATDGGWEAVAIAAALAAVTTRIEIGPSVFNAPYRSAALLARIADTIDEISGGRFVFGVGAGNTDDTDYRAFGFPTDHRYSRFEEAIEIIHGLLTNDSIDFRGEYHSAIESELVLRGPRPGGPPIIVAAGGPKMMRLAARFGSAWNWWTGDPAESVEALRPKVEMLEEACAEVGRDPETLGRTVDVYSFGVEGSEVADHVFSGSDEEIAELLLDHRVLGIDEVRVDLHPKTTEAIERFAPIVAAVHAA